MIATIQKINLESFALVLFMILQLYTSVVSRLGIKYGFVLVLYLFQDISSCKSEKGANIKLSRAGFVYKEKR